MEEPKDLIVALDRLMQRKGGKLYGEDIDRIKQAINEIKRLTRENTSLKLKAQKAGD